MNKRCTQVSRAASQAQAVISFADGTEVHADVAIGADGIKSVVRGAVTGHDPRQDIRFSGSICYRGMIPTTKLEEVGVQTDLKSRPVCFVGKSKVGSF